MQQFELKVGHGDSWQELDLVFPGGAGKPMHASTVRRHFQQTLKTIDVPRIRFHDVRHCCATLLLAQNIHPKAVQEQLGHASMYITMDTYSHVLAPMQVATAATMDRVLAPVATPVARVER